MSRIPLVHSWVEDAFHAYWSKKKVQIVRQGTELDCRLYNDRTEVTFIMHCIFLNLDSRNVCMGELLYDYNQRINVLALLLYKSVMR